MMVQISILVADSVRIFAGIGVKSCAKQLETLTCCTTFDAVSFQIITISYVTFRR
jgi:hypothetical protein